MEIIKQLHTPYGDGIDAVMLNDEGEEYPVFLESLNNTVILPALIASGYTLEKLPYGFVKNGVRLEDLPKENYTPDEKTEELMYNSIGVKIPNEELTKHITASYNGVPIPRTDYTIFTREDFLSYLDAVSKADLEDDYMPLNYFVAPEARFTITEWKSAENHEYVQIIDDRRKMSLSKFNKLINSLKRINLPENYTVMDVIDAYFAWGMDGLQFDVMMKRRESRAFRLVPNRTVNAPMTTRTFGFIDGSRNILTPKHLQNINWKLENRDPKFVDAITSNIRPNDTVLVGFEAGAKQEVTTLEGKHFDIRYSSDIVIMQLQTYNTILVQSPVSTHEYIDLELALPSKREELVEYCIISALAKMLYEYRKPTIKVSSYDALKSAGCNPRTALDYIITKYDMSKDNKNNLEDAGPQVFDYDIDSYLSGDKDLREDVRDFLDDVVEGVFNIDNIEKGKQIEATVSITSVYKEIYALHYVMGISFDDIYNKIKTITPEMRYIEFTDGKLVHRIDVSPMNYSITGYKHDLMSYDLDNAKNCTFFTYVTLIAREVGDERARRHVGIEFLMVNKRHALVRQVLSELEVNYTHRVQTYCLDATEQAKNLRLAPMFALSRLFEIIIKGTITWPKILGGNVENAQPETRSNLYKYVERKIENTTAYCAFTARTENSKSLSFNAYCVNAYITPEYVIPRSEAPIREIPFFSAWYNWRDNQPATWQALVNAGVISSDFVAWELRYGSEQFVRRDFCNLDSVDSLMHYYDSANEEINIYPNDKDFISVKHPIEYMFPGLQKDDLDKYDDMTTLPVPREGNPVVRIGITHNLTKDDYLDKLLPNEEIVKKDVYIRQFGGFDAAALMTVNDVFDKIPAQEDLSLTVMAKSETVYVPDTKEVMHFTRIPNLDLERYGIKHIYDRMYLFRATNGKLWEARI